MNCREWNFDGIVGPTHNYAGLAYGNVASQANRFSTSNPRAAALQGLAKMRYLRSLGFAQAVLPPVPRPRLDILKRLGFSGQASDMVAAAGKADPAILAACYSASSMWTANAATVSPSADANDRRVHFTPANLCTSLHRAIEPHSTEKILAAIFSDATHFQVHQPLPFTATTSDEGAANHTRLCKEHGAPAIEVFAYGRNALDSTRPAPQRFPARQTLQASQAITRLHRLDPNRTIFVQQNPAVIDQGVFHNDVICVGNTNVLMMHELAFLDTKNFERKVKADFESSFDASLYLLKITEKELPIADAVSSYLFNSQLLSRSDGSMMLLCPNECKENAAAHAVTQRLLEDKNPIEQVSFMDLRQSMNNGGGPACLRLRVVLNEDEEKYFHQGVVFTEQLDQQLVDWVQRNYREELSPEQLRDPALVVQCQEAFSELESILDFPAGVLSI
jgi:succinylarginine dihydrolase